MTRGGSAGWVALRAVIPDLAEEEVVARLAEASLGAEVRHAGPGRSLLTVYLDVPVDSEVLLARGASAIEAAGLDPRSCDLAVETVADGRWDEAWRASLRPFPLGSRFLVVPADPPVERSERTILRLVPGRAFGTGEHPTTRLCAETLERRVRPQELWLDLGAGTGILAMVAVHAGAAGVLAVDRDPEAVEVCRETLEANGLSGPVRPVLGGIDVVKRGAFAGVVANIASSFFLRHAADVAAALRPGGTLVASGFLVEDVAEIEAFLAGAGLVSIESRSDGPWALVVAAKAGR